MDETTKAFGRIDILVCNAAPNRYYEPTPGISDEEFREILENNVLANHWVIQMAAPGILERNDGSIAGGHLFDRRARGVACDWCL